MPISSTIQLTHASNVEKGFTVNFELTLFAIIARTTYFGESVKAASL